MGGDLVESSESKLLQWALHLKRTENPLAKNNRIKKDDDRIAGAIRAFKFIVEMKVEDKEESEDSYVEKVADDKKQSNFTWD